jgi:hypothetical protein
MTDPQAFASALTAVKTAIDIAKGLRTASAGMERAELQLKIGELATLLTDARMSMVDAQEENLELRRKVMELEQGKATRESLTFRDAAYWRKDMRGKEEGPFCSRCHDADSKLVRMSNRGNGYICCPACHFCIDDPVRPPPSRLRSITDAEDDEPPY